MGVNTVSVMLSHSGLIGLLGEGGSSLTTPCDEGIGVSLLGMGIAIHAGELFYRRAYLRGWYGTTELKNLVFHMVLIICMWQV